MLVPAPKPQWARRSCAVVSSSVAARNVSILDRARCHYHCWNLCCHNKETIVAFYHCSCVEDLESEWGNGIAPALLREKKKYVNILQITRAFLLRQFSIACIENLLYGKENSARLFSQHLSFSQIPLTFTFNKSFDRNTN